MAHVKGILVGGCAAILAVLAWIVASVSIDVGAGGGVAAVAFDSASITLAALVGFIVGFWLHRVRARRRRS